jgi:hypothetical protein
MEDVMKNSKWLVVVMCVLVVAFMSGTPAMALPGWAFSDGFEGVTGGSLPSAADLDPDPLIWNKVDMWENGVGNQTVIQVGNNPGVARSGNNYVSLKNSFAAGYNSPPGHFLFERWWDGNLDSGDPLVGLPLVDGDFTWQFSMRVSDTASGMRAFLGSHSPYPSWNCQQALGIGIENSKITRFYHDGEYSTGFNVLANTWYDVIVVADWETKTFDLSVNGSALGNFSWNLDHPIRSMHVASDADGSLLDNVSLVPEPVTVGLLFLGLPLLRRRK